MPLWERIVGDAVIIAALGYAFWRWMNAKERLD